MEAGASEVVINITNEGIEIIDNGEGISAEQAAQIKEKGTTKEGRQGLGLKLVKGMFGPMGWKLEMGNNKQEGLRVMLKRP
jgi:signal transduction histidine kinase